MVVRIQFSSALVFYLITFSVSGHKTLVINNSLNITGDCNMLRNKVRPVHFMKVYWRANIWITDESRYLGSRPDHFMLKETVSGTH